MVIPTTKNKILLRRQICDSDSERYLKDQEIGILRIVATLVTALYLEKHKVLRFCSQPHGFVTLPECAVPQ
jgi:hypothetical protein